MGLPENFKMTELGPLPEEWEVLKINSFCNTQAGGTPSTFKLEYWNGNIPWINSGSLKNEVIKTPNKYITELGLANSAAKLWPKNSVLIALTGATTGMVGILDFDCSANQSVVAMLPNEKYSSKYLFYHLIYSRKRILGYKMGAAQPHINKAIVDNFLVALPPLSEQKKIAAVLAAVQEAKEKTEEVIKATKELKKSLMKHLFTYGPVPVEEAEKVKLKKTEIGEIPEEWEVVQLGEVFETLRNGTTKKQNKVGKGLPVSRIETISSGKINPQKVGYIEGLTREEIEKYKLIEGDILFSHINSEPYLGNSAIYENDPKILIHGMNLLMLRTKQNKLNSRFLNYLFNLYRQKGIFVGVASRAVNQSSINQGKLKLLKIPLPPLPIQQKIASILSAVDEKIQAEENKKKALEDLFKTLLHNLMTAKIRVNEIDFENDKKELSLVADKI